VIVLPPKVYFYEPVIHGFKVAGKRGSKYFEPHSEAIVATKEDSLALAQRMQPQEPDARKPEKKPERKPELPVVETLQKQEQPRGRKRNKRK
jgi:hypothetical protein